MQTTTERKKSVDKSRESVQAIHKKMDEDPRYPFNLQSRWLPPSSSPAWQAFYDHIFSTANTSWAPCIQAMSDLIDGNEVLTYLVNNACKENQNLRNSNNLDNPDNVVIPPIESKDDLLNAFNTILSHAPRYYNDDLVGLPFSAIVVGIDATPSGIALFSLPMFNEKMAAILTVWNGYLDTLDSAVGFTVEGEQWLSPAAKQHYDFDLWAKDSQTLPYWTSWNSFFTRQFLNPTTERPIAGPDNDMIVNCPNDGSLFRWRSNIQTSDVFWFKDMEYSLSDILSSPDPGQQAIIDQEGLVDIFTGGYILQTYLNPYNFHRWWVPVNGTVAFEPLVVPGFFFNKLVIPDYGGATTASLPYLAQVNARGIIVFNTAYGRVCCIPLGMSETSTISFDPTMTVGASVQKGQEMGTFNYGGSSFAILYENIPGSVLHFEDADGTPLPQNPPLPQNSSDHGVVTNIGQQLGRWLPIC